MRATVTLAPESLFYGARGGTNLISADDADNTASVSERDYRPILVNHVCVVTVGTAK